MHFWRSKKNKFLLLFLLGVFVLVYNGCSTTDNSDSSEAVILGFSIVELPQQAFEIDETKRLISIDGGISSIDFSDLTASFITSEGSSVFVNDSLQTSGVSKNDFREGITYSVVSEDGMRIRNYFVYLTENLPKNYFVEGEIGVEVNPTGIAPLSAYLNIQTKRPSEISFRILGQTEIISPEFSRSISHKLPIHGLYANTLNHVVLSIVDENGSSLLDTLTMQTGALPEFFPEIEINTVQESNMEEGLHYAEFNLGNAGEFESYPFIYDNEGKVRWYLDLKEYPGITWGIKFQEDQTFFASVRTGIIELDKMGNLLRNIDTPGIILHHDVIKLPNGNYVAIGDKDGTRIIKNGEEMVSVEDFLIEVDGNSGEIINEWDMGEVLDVSRVDVVDGGRDWFHANAVWYDENDETLIISGRNQGLVKVDWDNQLKWILATHKGWGNAGRTGEGFDTTPFLLEAISNDGTPFAENIQNGDVESDDFSWTWGQHAPMILPNGNLFLFDNGTNRNYGSTGSYSQATEYEIDATNKTIKLVWSYGKGRGSETFSNIISDVDLLPQTGNRLFAPGFITGSDNKAKVVEITYPGKDVVFESTLTFKDLFGNGAGWGQIDIVYRAERVTLY